jgi:hypothetical protein
MLDESYNEESDEELPKKILKNKVTLSGEVIHFITNSNC